MNTRPRRTLLGRLTAAGLAIALAALTLGGAPSASADTLPPSPTTPATVSADPLPTWQLNGVVWSQVVVGTTVYATGAFTKARPPGVGPGGAGEVTASNLFAYDITTGNRVATFDHALNAQGRAITRSPDGSRIYVGGDFTTVDGQSRVRLAAFDTATGALVSTFRPSAANSVRALAATNTTLYAGGTFESASGQTRRRLASFATNNGAILPWAPRAEDGYVHSLVVAPDGSKVVLGGQFLVLNGANVHGMGAVNPTTGANLPWAASVSVIHDYNNGAINSLTTDGTYIYGTGYAFGSGGRFEGSFSLNPSNGSIRWLTDCLGDHYDIEPVGQVAYTASHAHDCRTVGGFPDTSPRTRWQHAGAVTNFATKTITQKDAYGWSFIGQPAPDVLQWYPTLGIGQASGQFQAAWSVTSGSGYVAYGGEFPTVNGKAQQGLTRFAAPGTGAGVPPNKIGPQYLDTAPVRQAEPATTATVTTTGVRVTYGAAWDKDNQRLTYQLYRDRGTPAEALLRTHTVDSNFWTLPSQTFTDLTPPPGSHTYQVRITDGFGNELLSPVSNTVTPSGNATPTAAFTATTSGLTANVDGSGSSDPDGTVASYAWDFGDGTTGTGSTASHAYQADGAYPITLTVTDNAGGTHSVTKSVTVSAPPAPGVLASDTFNRSVAGGWGSAEVGGAWTHAGSTSLFSVGNGSGNISLNAGSGPGSKLGISSTDTDLQFSFSFDKAATGGAQYVRAVARGTESNGYKANVLKSATSNTMTVTLTRVVANAETSLGSKTLTTTFAPGASYTVRMQAWGTGTTNLRTRVWASGSTEPTTWDLSTTDATASLQAAGGIAVQGYLSGAATNAPVVLSVRGLSARVTGN